MTDLARIEQIITRALLEGCDNHRTRAQIARQAARQVVKNLPASESRAERLMHAMEGELDGFTCDVDAAMRILAHVDAGEMEVPTIAHFVEAGRRLATNHDLAKSLSVFVDYWGLDCYTPPAEAIDAVRDIVRALLLLAQETDALSVGSARQVMEVAPRQDDFLRRMAMFFDRDATAGPFCAEDGDGGFVAAAERMAREIDRLRATLFAAPNAPMDAVGLAQDEVELSGISGELIDLVAEAIRADGSDLCDGAWAAVPETSKMGWREDAVRALNALINARPVVKDFLTTTTPPLARETARQVMGAPIEPCNSVGWQRKYKYEINAPGSFDVWRECPQSEATGFQTRVPGYEYRPVFAHPSPSYDDGIKEGLRRAAALVREKHIVHGAGMDLLVPRWGGNISGLAYADAIEALSLLPKEEGR